MTTTDRMKRWIWRRLIYPIFPYVQKGLTAVGILHHHKRQSFLLGWLKSDRTIHDFLTYIESKGFGNHFIAWNDPDQFMSLRKFDGFQRQYHLRIFTDGEIRGHYEETPESHPVDHFLEKGLEERRGQFLQFLGDWVQQDKP